MPARLIDSVPNVEYQIHEGHEPVHRDRGDGEAAGPGVGRFARAEDYMDLLDRRAITASGSTGAREAITIRICTRLIEAATSLSAIAARAHGRVAARIYGSRSSHGTEPNFLVATSRSREK